MIDARNCGENLDKKYNMDFFLFGLLPLHVAMSFGAWKYANSFNVKETKKNWSYFHVGVGKTSEVF